MNSIDKMIQELCHDGVEYKTLGELGKFYGGLSGKSKSDFENGNAKYISYMNVYSNPAVDTTSAECVNVSEGEKQNTIQKGDVLFTGSSETPNECGMTSVVVDIINEPIYLNSFCFGFRFDDSSLYNVHFLKHIFRDNELRRQIIRTASGVTRFNVSKKKMEKVSIPLPPLPVQERIVEVLDKFSQLEAELEAELDCRKRQYEFYRDKLFTFDDSVQIKTLGEVGTFTRGKRFVRTDIVESGVPCIHYGDIYTFYGLCADKTKTFLNAEKAEKMRFAHKNDVVIVGAGENNMDIGVGVAWLGDEEAAVHDACYIFKSDLNPRYVSHFLRTTGYHLQIKKYVSEGKICSISAQGIGKATIPVPSKDVQIKIADILDRFETLTTDLQSGLPAEIEARRMQYEHYRERLLTFKQKQNG